MAIQAQLYPDSVIGGFQLGGTQQDYWMMDNGCGGDGGSTSTSTINNAMVFQSQSIVSVLAEEQRREVDRFITLQNERLRLALQEQRRQLLTILLSKFESKILPLLKQKDEVIAQAAKRTTDLENFLRNLEMESQAWQRVAKEKEAMVVSLNNTLEELRERACVGGLLYSNGADLDAESCCDVNLRGGAEEGTGENRGNCDALQVEEEQIDKRKMVCQICHAQRSCVMLLPCRHLCSCKACENLLHYCPICTSVKKASIEVIII